MAEKKNTGVLFSIEASATFLAADIEAAMITVADHLKKVATDPDYDDTIFESGSIEIKKVDNGHS
jgi:hypothetical protein